MSNTEFHVEFFDPAGDTFFYIFPDELFFQKGSRHANLTAHMHYQTDDCFFIMLVDVTSTTSLTSARQCFRMQLDSNSKNRCVMVLASKTDSPDRKITSEAIASLAKEHGAAFFEVSALTGTNVEESFQAFLEQVMPRAIQEKAAYEEALNRETAQTDSASFCCVL